MTGTAERSGGPLQGTPEEIHSLRDYAGDPSGFWPAYAESAVRLVGALHLVLVVEDPASAGGWKTIHTISVPGAEPSRAPFSKAVPDLAMEAASAGTARQAMSAGPGSLWPTHCVAVRLDTGREGDVVVLVSLLAEASEERAKECLVRLHLIAGGPAVYQTNRLLQQARGDVTTFADVVDLLAALQTETRFLAVALTFCNELAGRYQCGRVSLGWAETDGYIRVCAMSHTEKFEPKMDAVKRLGFAMEEALDQDDEVVWPAPEDARVVVREHEAYAKSQGIDSLLSLPLRVDDKPVAVVTCERGPAGFQPLDLQRLRLSCDLVARRLGDLKQWDRWFGARWLSSAREGLSTLVGPEHTWAKIAGIVGAVALGVLLFGHGTYRVEAPFILKAEQIVHIPAPFGGYISEVHAEIGQAVDPGDALLQLDTRDLHLEEAAALAERERYRREADKARAQEQLAAMQIAGAQAEQAAAQLQRIRDRLSRAAVTAPIRGVIVSGDLEERIGSPVELGEELFRVARLNDLYVHLMVPEADIHELEVAMEGQIAFSSQPRLKFPMTVRRVDPVAEAMEGENTFAVRCELSGPPEAWWRPGMSGIAKINIGRRSFLYMFSHRTVDFLRMRLWW